MKKIRQYLYYVYITIKKQESNENMAKYTKLNNKIQEL